MLGELLDLPPPEAAALPSRLRMPDVQAVEDLTGRLVSLARQWGGQADTFGSVADRCTRLMGVSATDPVRARLGSALAEMHTEAGWCCFDVGEHAQAQHHYQRAVELARDVDDGYQVAYALRHAGLLPAETGEPNDALKQYQMAQVSLWGTADDDGRVAALDAWLHAQSATALASMRRPELARDELARAREAWRA